MKITREEWHEHCRDFDKSIENLHSREDLTDEEIQEIQAKWTNDFNIKMNNLRCLTL